MHPLHISTWLKIGNIAYIILLQNYTQTEICISISFLLSFSMLQVFCKLGVKLSLKDEMCRSLVPSTNTHFQGALVTRCLSPQLIWYPKRQKLFLTYFFPHNEKEDCNCDKMSKHQQSPNNPRPEYTSLKLQVFEGKTRNKENEQILFLLSRI